MFDIGKAIKTLKVQRNLSNEELAFLCGRNHATVSAWINGKQKPGIKEIELMCKQTKVLMSDFFRWGE